MMKKKAALVFLALVLGLFSGCGVEAEDPGETEAKVDTSSEALGTCTRPIRATDEDEYMTCMSSCLQTWHDYSGCKKGCCSEVTGCIYCYQQ